MEWATQGLVVPHIGRTIEAISAGLQSLKAGHGVVGKVAVIVDRDLVPDASSDRSRQPPHRRTCR